MDVLKKIESATLMEALVATVLIVVLFIVCSLVINNLLLNQFNNNTAELENRLSQLEYQYQNHSIGLPYEESYNNWIIDITKEPSNTAGVMVVFFKAKKNQSTKAITKKRLDAQ